MSGFVKDGVDKALDAAESAEQQRTGPDRLDSRGLLVVALWTLILCLDSGLKLA